jgi:ketosteroid isomerase-like protein
MSTNKHTVERYMEGFRRSDHDMVLSCLTDDVEWLIPGMFHISGKAAFDKEIENEAFVGRPDITVSQLTEEADIVVAEGTARARKRDGGIPQRGVLRCLHHERWQSPQARFVPDGDQASRGTLIAPRHSQEFIDEQYSVARRRAQGGLARTVAQATHRPSRRGKGAHASA